MKVTHCFAVLILRPLPSVAGPYGKERGNTGLQVKRFFHCVRRVFISRDVGNEARHYNRAGFKITGLDPDGGGTIVGWGVDAGFSKIFARGKTLLLLLRDGVHKVYMDVIFFHQ